MKHQRSKWQLFKGLNGSKDNTVPIIKSFKNKYPDHIIPIYLEKNCGTTYSRNLALKKQKAEKLQKKFIRDFRLQ